jgi:hypothetical protein
VAPSTLSEAAAATAKIRLNISEPLLCGIKWPVSGQRHPLAKGCYYRFAQKRNIEHKK